MNRLRGTSHIHNSFLQLRDEEPRDEDTHDAFNTPTTQDSINDHTTINFQQLRIETQTNDGDVSISSEDDVSTDSQSSKTPESGDPKRIKFAGF